MTVVEGWFILLGLMRQDWSRSYASLLLLIEQTAVLLPLQPVNGGGTCWEAKCSDLFSVWLSVCIPSLLCTNLSHKCGSLSQVLVSAFQDLHSFGSKEHTHKDSFREILKLNKCSHQQRFSYLNLFILSCIHYVYYIYIYIEAWGWRDGDDDCW